MLSDTNLQAIQQPEQPTDLTSAPEAQQATRFATPLRHEPPMRREVIPAAEPVNGEQLLDDIFATIKRYVIAEDATIQTATLWAVHTWLMDVWTVSPIANVTACEMRCGKTLLLQVLEELVYRPMATSNISSAALFRAVDEWQPTLLIDEVDSFLKGNADARGMLNSGLYRKSAFVMRCGGDSHVPTQFSVWGAKALSGIGSLATTLADRSIALRLRRKLPTESTENLRRSSPEQWAGLRSRIARWTDDHRDALSRHVPESVLGINDRANDCWEPLLSIAETAGTRWTAYARAAAQLLQEGEDDSPSLDIELLKSVRKAFWPSYCTKLFRTALLARVNGSDERWSRFNQGRPLTAHQLAGMLRRFGIHAKPIRIGEYAGKNGYERSSVEEACARYVPPEPQKEPNYWVDASAYAA